MRVETLELQEYLTQSMPKAALPESVGTSIWNRFGNKVDIEFPTPKTANQWQLTPKGWAGHIPVDENFHVISSDLSVSLAIQILFHVLIAQIICISKTA